MIRSDISIRDVHPDEFDDLGRLLVDVYSRLDGFPREQEQPAYYEMLRNIGGFTGKKDAHVLVAVTGNHEIVGGVVYFGDMAEYGSGGTATQARNASGIRLLGVHSKATGRGVGKALTNACIQLARCKGHGCVILHTTQAMQVAWRLYEKLGFERAEELDFTQKGLPVFGFRLELQGG